MVTVSWRSKLNNSHSWFCGSRNPGSTVAFTRVEGGNRATTESQPLVTGLREGQANALYAEGIDVATTALNGLDYEVPRTPP